MSFSIIKKLPAAETLMQEIPLRDAGYEKISRDRKEIKDIISGKDKRLLMIVGPCSAWPSQAVLQYAHDLRLLSETLQDVMKIVMRVYIQKPRTQNGWAGPVSQPHPLLPPDTEAGLRYARQMMIDVINTGLPLAGEALFTHNTKPFIELLSWVAIGARSSEDQEHRIFASSLDCPVGLKNPTHGSLDVAVNSVSVAQSPHVSVFDRHEVQTHGNHYAHLILRGANKQPNVSPEALLNAASLMRDKNIIHPSLIIDASHDNAMVAGQKDYMRQNDVVQQVLDTLAQEPALKSIVKGFMLESFIKAGSQKIDSDNPERIDMGGLSITDPCLSWEQTQSLLCSLARRLRT